MINPAELLIERFLDLSTLERNVRTWSMDTFWENEPRKARLAMIDSLFGCLGIRCGYVQFAGGQAVQHLLPVDRVLEIMAEAGIRKESWLAPDSEARLREAWTLEVSRTIFVRLLEDRVSLEIHSSRENGSLAMSIITILPQVIIGRTNQKLAEAATPVNQLLAAFLNPEKMTVTLETLRAKHGYPDVDLGQLDMGWF